MSKPHQLVTELANGPAVAASGVEAHQSLEEALYGGLLVEEVAAGVECPAELSVGRLVRVRGAYRLADFGVEVEERHELGPRVGP